MLKTNLSFILLFLFTFSCLSQNIEHRLQFLTDSIYNAFPDASGIMVHVEAPKHGISWSGASGYSDKVNKTKLEADQPALIASSIKTYVAATILRMVEMKKFSLQSPIKDLLSTQTKKIFTEDGYNLDSIKLKHLLSHTSGVKDYTHHDYVETLFETIDADKKHRWTRDEQLALTIEVGDPLGPPGAQFNYADANYLLLTEIMENISGRPFYEVMRSLLKYEELGLNNTWFPTLEKKPHGTKNTVHQYFGKYKWDSYDHDISWDLYGGGGIATTTSDIAKFSYHLFNGDIIDNNEVRDSIYLDIRTKETEIYPYYLGLTPDKYHGMNGYGHGGFWGTVVLYFPVLDASVSVYILERDQRKLRRNVLESVTKVLKEELIDNGNKRQELIQYLSALKDFSGTILVGEHNKIVYQQAYGLANIEFEVPNNLNTQFNIASITKSFTAVATLKLVEEGLIDRNKNVGQYLPDYPNALVKDSVTVHQLLTHTSGLKPFYGKKYLEANKLRYNQISDYLSLFVQDTLLFKPGNDYYYSGSGFVVVGLIIEEVTGKSYYDYLQQSVFGPAGMRNTFPFKPDTVVTNKASGYTAYANDGYYSKNEDYISIASPGGGYYSTAHDLYRFSKALSNNTLLKAETTSMMLQPKVRGFITHLGYGIDIDQRYDETIIGHSGGWFGIRGEWMDFIGSGFTVVVLSNKDDDGKSGASQIINEVKEIIGGRKK